MSLKMGNIQRPSTPFSSNNISRYTPKRLFGDAAASSSNTISTTISPVTKFVPKVDVLNWERFVENICEYLDYRSSIFAGQVNSAWKQKFNPKLTNKSAFRTLFRTNTVGIIESSFISLVNSQKLKANSDPTPYLSRDNLWHSVVMVIISSADVMELSSSTIGVASGLAAEFFKKCDSMDENAENEGKFHGAPLLLMVDTELLALTTIFLASKFLDYEPIDVSLILHHNSNKLNINKESILQAEITILSMIGLQIPISKYSFYSNILYKEFISETSSVHKTSKRIYYREVRRAELLFLEKSDIASQIPEELRTSSLVLLANVLEHYQHSKNSSKYELRSNTSFAIHYLFQLVIFADIQAQRNEPVLAIITLKLQLAAAQEYIQYIENVPKNSVLKRQQLLNKLVTTSDIAIMKTQILQELKIMYERVIHTHEKLNTNHNSASTGKSPTYAIQQASFPVSTRVLRSRSKNYTTHSYSSLKKQKLSLDL